ncbi:MAG: molybdate ABC transporter substrate-binding protein [Fibrobacteres bacterium]|nr:molybdate ABC transporter substrate-binding protein [Fibrobacterota bacterium]
MRKYQPIFLFILFSLSSALRPVWGKDAPQFTAAVAANVQFAMEELKADFKKSAGVEVKTVYGSSGKLAAQIKNGAPFDVFISADMDFPDSLAKWGYASAKPKPYAYGKLVLWTMRDSDPSKGLSLLAEAGVEKIALADSERAPYGREAVKALKKSGYYDRVKKKLVFGESISQVNQYVLLGTADIGITAKSVVLAADMRGKGKWADVDSTAYDPIAQGAVICKYGAENNPGPSAKFLEYLYSAPARIILAKYGYLLP